MDYQKENSLISSVQAGNTDAFEQLVKAHQSPVNRIIGNLAGSSKSIEVEDLAQDVFVAAFKNIGRFDPRKGRFRSWLYAIARNLAKNALRKKREQPWPEHYAEADSRTPSDTLHIKEIYAQLDQALNQLTFSERTIFVLAELEELTCAEIAGIEKMPIGTVKSKLARTRIKLRALINTYFEK
jgi:RNA polymerase sigma-70 factor (ECF subfamily)